jgi:hypothetical protein
MATNRRNFVGALGAAPLFVPQSAFGANDKITYAAIATGGRGRYLMGKFKQLGAVCAAVCDVYEPNLQKAAELEPEAKRFVDYRELLEGVRADCVVIASPDHHHAPMLMAALAAKKDVYLEKPLSHSLEQSGRMIEAVRASKQVVQIGMQRRSAPALIEAKRMVDDGLLGRVALVKAQWNWNISGAAGLEPVPGYGAAKGSGADAVSEMAVFPGLCGREHDGPGDAPDGRGAVVHEERGAGGGAGQRVCGQDAGGGASGCVQRGV